jgi:hypothetical protein
MRTLRTSYMEFVQNDLKVNKFNIYIKYNEQSYDLTGCDITITFKKPDKTVVIGRCNIINATNGMINYILGTQEITAFGIVNATISIYGADEQKLTSKDFNFVVKEALDNVDEIIVSTNEFTVLDNLINKVSDINKNESAREQIKIEMEELIDKFEVLDVTKLQEEFDNINTKFTSYTTYANVTAVSNVYNLNISTNQNFAIETTDVNNKTIAFINIPTQSNIIISVCIKLKYTNASSIIYPANTVWQNGVTPTYIVGKEYLLMFSSYNNGGKWLASKIGVW